MSKDGGSGWLESKNFVEESYLNQGEAEVVEWSTGALEEMKGLRGMGIW